MASSAEIALLTKIAELAKRFGMRPSEADATIYTVTNERDDIRFEISFTGMTNEKKDNFFSMMDALRMTDRGVIEGGEFSDLEDAVDRALSLAPRSRTL